MRLCRKRTGPRESSLIATAIVARSGASTSRMRPAPTKSNERLTAPEERVRPNRRIPSRVIPSTSSSSTDEPTTSGSRGSTLTLSPIDLQGPSRVQEVVGDLSARRDDRALDPFRGEQALQSPLLGRRCEPLEPLEPLAPLTREPFQPGTPASGARATTRALNPGASRNRRVIHFAVSASPRIRHRSSPDSARATCLARVRIVTMLANSSAHTATAWSRPKVPSTILSPASQMSSA